MRIYKHTYMCTYVCVYIYIYIYIYSLKPLGERKLPLPVGERPPFSLVRVSQKY